MKQTLVMMAAVPIACLMAGYGAGKFIAPAPSASAAVESGVEPHLDPAAEGGGTASGTPPNAHAADEEQGPYVVDLGQMTVPVYKPSSVTYVVAEFGITLLDRKNAVQYDMPEHATRLRDAILSSLARAADGPMLKGVAVDTEALTSTILADLSPSFPGIEDVLLLSFYKKDVPRS